MAMEMNTNDTSPRDITKRKFLNSSPQTDVDSDEEISEIMGEDIGDIHELSRKVKNMDITKSTTITNHYSSFLSTS